MILYFAASGHSLYAKSAHIFANDARVATDTFFTDLIIEQVLTRDIKASGGLTKGSGISETQRNVRLQFLSSCAHVDEDIREFSETSE